MSTLVLPVHPRSMKVTSFKGDDAKLLDKLILASQRSTATPATLQERPLVPYFDSSDSDSSFAMLQQQPGSQHSSKPLAVPAHGGHAAGLKRHAHERSSAHLSGSPPKKENEVVQAKHQRQRAAKQAASASTTTTTTTRVGGKGSGSDSEMSSAPQQAQQRKARGAKAAAAAQAPQQPQGKKQGKQAAAAAAAAATADMRQLAAASSAAGAALRTPGGDKAAGKGQGLPLPYKFAGPAFTNSPMPDSLPIPTSSLLLQEAAEGLRSRLIL